jgi:hypothetical protein
MGASSDPTPRKRPNKGRQLPAEVVEGRASPKGNSRQAAVVRTLSRVATSIRLAAVRRQAAVQTVVLPTFDPREEPGALAAHAGICAGGDRQTVVPTATFSCEAAPIADRPRDWQSKKALFPRPD